jgi:hypothetical protein
MHCNNWKHVVKGEKRIPLSPVWPLVPRELLQLLVCLVLGQLLLRLVQVMLLRELPPAVEVLRVLLVNQRPQR